MNTAPATINQLIPGMTLYQVLIPDKILGPNGETAYKTMGPYPEIGSASQAAAKYPGALLASLTVHFQTPPLATLTPKAN